MTRIPRRGSSRMRSRTSAQTPHAAANEIRSKRITGAHHHEKLVVNDGHTGEREGRDRGDGRGRRRGGGGVEGSLKEAAPEPQAPDPFLLLCPTMSHGSLLEEPGFGQYDRGV